MRELLELLANADASSRALSVSLLVAARVAPLTIVAPWLTMRNAPALVRASVVLALTVTLAPLAFSSAPENVPSDGALLGLMAIREAFVGGVFAVLTALPLFALDWAGRLVDTWRGASLAEVIAPPTGERTSPLGDLYLMGGVVVFLLVGGHRVALAAFADGLQTVPVGDLGFAGQGSVDDLARLFASALAMAVSFAAPAAAAVLIVETCLGLLGRAAPQVPVFFAGMPLRAAAGLAACLVSVSLVMDQVPDAIETHIESAADLLFGPG